METVINEIVEAAKEIARTDSEFNSEAGDDVYAFMRVMWSDDDMKRHGVTSDEYHEAMLDAWRRSSEWRFKPEHYHQEA